MASKKTSKTRPKPPKKEIHIAMDAPWNPANPHWKDFMWCERQLSLAASKAEAARKMADLAGARKKLISMQATVKHEWRECVGYALGRCLYYMGRIEDAKVVLEDVIEEGDGLGQGDGYDSAALAFLISNIDPTYEEIYKDWI